MRAKIRSGVASIERATYFRHLHFAMMIHMLIKIKLYTSRIGLLKGSRFVRAQATVKIDIRYSRRWKWLLLLAMDNNMCVTGRWLLLEPKRRNSSIESLNRKRNENCLTFECWSTASQERNTWQLSTPSASRVNNLIKVYWLNFLFFFFWWLMRHPHEPFGTESTRDNQKNVCLVLRLDSAVPTGKYGNPAPPATTMNLCLSRDTNLFHLWSSNVHHKWTLSIIQFSGDYRRPRPEDWRRARPVIEWRLKGRQECLSDWSLTTTGLRLQMAMIS